MSTQPAIALHHAGIWVTDFDRMVAFYRSIFNFHISDKGRYPDGKRLVFLTLDPNAHHTFVIGEGRPAGSPSTVNQLSFRTDSLASVRHYWEAVTREQVPRIVPVTHGNAWSVYFWDPEDNRVEVFADTPWHVPQPFREAIDFSKSDAEIIEFTRALAQERVGFQPFAAWRKETAHAMDRDDWPLIED
jgi:catechol 2,3-dioxygenase-like lactoylglutathione lyase family enzyme